MELNQTQKRTVFYVTAEQNGWKVDASVTVEDGKITGIDGVVFKEGGQNVSFNGYRSGNTIVRSVHNVTDVTYGVYDVIEEFLTSAEEKYNN